MKLGALLGPIRAQSLVAYAALRFKPGDSRLEPDSSASYRFMSTCVCGLNSMIEICIVLAAFSVLSVLPKCLLEYPTWVILSEFPECLPECLIDIVLSVCSECSPPSVRLSSPLTKVSPACSHKQKFRIYYHPHFGHSNLPEFLISALPAVAGEKFVKSSDWSANEKWRRGWFRVSGL